MTPPQQRLSWRRLAGGELCGWRLFKRGLAAKSLVSPYEVRVKGISYVVRVHHRCRVSDVVDVNGPRANDDIPQLNPRDRGCCAQLRSPTRHVRREAYNMPLFSNWIGRAYADPQTHDFSPLHKLFANRIAGSMAMATRDRVNIDLRLVATAYVQ